MYSGAGALGSTAVAAGGLAATGMNIVWVVLAAFALTSAGMALLRIVPRREA